jgi:hypothetical protein
MLSVTPLFRCYPTPIEDEDDEKRGFADMMFEADSAIALEIARVGHPWAGLMLLFDCETLTDAHGGQRLRFGFFQQRGMRYDLRVADAKAGKLTREKLDELWKRGIFYDPQNCTDDEIEVMENYAMEHDVDIMEVDEFIRKILHHNYYVKYADDWKERLREPCLVIGHNLPFDLGAIAIHCGLAEKDLYGGLSLVLSGGPHDVLDRTPRAVPLVGEARRAVRPSPVGRGERLADLRGPRDRGERRIHRHAARRNRTCRGADRGGTRPAGIRGDDGNRHRVADIRRDGNIGGSGCPSDRRPRAFPLIGEGGWIVRAGASCRRQRLAHLGGSGDRWDRAVRRDDVDDGAGRRTGRGET